MRFVNSNASMGLVEVRRVSLNPCGACRRLVEVGRVHFEHRKCVKKLGESVLNTAKRVGLESPFLITVKRVGGF